MPGRFSGPQFTIRNCGYLMNHYCIGLVDLNRANRTIGREGRKRAYLLHARRTTEYTLRGMRGYPNCSIRDNVETTYRIINDELKAMP